MSQTPGAPSLLIKQAFRCEQKQWLRNFANVNAPCKAVHTDVTRLPLEELGAVDLLVAGFSCKSLSTMNRGRCSLVDKTSSSGQTWGGTLSYIDRWLPKRILLENVLGLVRKCRSAPKGGQIGWTLIQTALASLGYVCGYHIVSPEHFLLPQRRLRVYVWAEHGLDNGPDVRAWWAGFLTSMETEPACLEQFLVIE